MFNQLQSMRSFVEVVERGNFSRAAHALHLGPASVSEHVSNLERHLSVTLLKRTTRTLELTDEGGRYYELSKHVLDQMMEMEQALARKISGAEPAGLLRVEISEGIDELSLPALALFQELYPNIVLQILRSGHQFDFARSGADVMIRSVPILEDKGVVGSAIGRTRTIVAAAPSYLERYGSPERPADLKKHRCIGYIDPVSGRLWEWFFEEGGRTYSVDIDCPLSMAQGNVRRRAAMKGLGIINDLQHLVAPQVKEGVLIPLLEDWAVTQPIGHILYRREQRRTVRTSLFITFIRDWFDKNITPLDLAQQLNAPLHPSSS